jgi:glucose-6-phosphate 1-epimerase
MANINTKTHPNGLTYVEIDSTLCHARIFLQGAQIDTFEPKGKSSLLWVSQADDYQIGNGIRGGIPICWPWFGQSDSPNWPQHGFARTRLWSLTQVSVTDDKVTVALTLELTEEDRQYWPHNTQVSVLYTLTDTLTMSLINTNLSDDTVSLTQALHSYFPTSDIHKTKVSGFRGAKYIEFAQGPFEQDNDEVYFDRETDRVYSQLGLQQHIHTPEGVIFVHREQSTSAVLWNPWIEKSTRLSRFKPDDYLHMLCLEAANVLDDRVILAPGESHTLTTHIGWLSQLTRSTD